MFAVIALSEPTLKFDKYGTFQVVKLVIGLYIPSDWNNASFTANVGGVACQVSDPPQVLVGGKDELPVV
jgi:hypothetical protein